MSAPPVEGLQWMHLLIRYNFVTGRSEIVQSFSNPAKDSDIKKYSSAASVARKKKVMSKGKKIDIEEAVESSSNLF